MYIFFLQISQKYDAIKQKERSTWKNKSEEEKQQKYVEASRVVMEPLAEAIRPLYEPKIWEDISPQFVTTFWSLTMYDLVPPVQIYQKEVAKIKAMIPKVDDNKVVALMKAG